MTGRFHLVVIGELNPDAIVAGAAIEAAFGQAERLAEGGALASEGRAGFSPAAPRGSASTSPMSAW